MTPLKGIIYYTDNEFPEPLNSIVQRHIYRSALPVISTSLQPIRFGQNKVLHRTRGYVSYIKQIISCLERSTAKYVFFCEQDVLYHKSHFDFTPPTDDIFYYNTNVWRWKIGTRTAIRHDRMIPLSCMCANRELALKHYKVIEAKINEVGEDKFTSREPDFARKWGYEPGTKKIKRGGLTDEDFATWHSDGPNIDLRHRGSFSSPKLKQSDFKHPPLWWKEVDINDILEWNLEELI